MLRLLLRGSGSSLAILTPFDWINHDKLEVQGTKTMKEYLNRTDDETGMSRVKAMFTIDEFGRMSPEINSVYQAGFFGFFTGVIYGGFLKSRVAYLNFMENNEATAFESHLEAKKKLQHEVTMGFAKGALRWGWRLALFSSCYVAVVTIVSVYRGRSSVIEYISAGTITGSIFRMSLGFRGMISGGLIGGFLGGIAGCVSLLALMVSGSSMEDVRYWQYKWKIQREKVELDAMSKQTAVEDAELDQHTKKIGSKRISLDELEKPLLPQYKEPDNKNN